MLNHVLWSIRLSFSIPIMVKGRRGGKKKCYDLKKYDAKRDVFMIAP